MPPELQVLVLPPAVLVVVSMVAAKRAARMPPLRMQISWLNF